MLPSTRKLPHKTTADDFVQHMIKTMAEEINNDSEYVQTTGRSGELIVNHFKSLANKFVELAILQYYYDNAPIENFIEFSDEASIAIENLFKIMLSDGQPVSFNWRDKMNSARYPQNHPMGNKGELIRLGLSSALLSVNNSVLEYLTNIDPMLLITDNHLGVFEIEGILLQALCCNDEEKDSKLSMVLNKLPLATRTLDSKMVYATCEMYIAVGSANENDITRVIEKQLEVHKKFYDSDTGNRRHYSLGLISIKALCAVVLAHARGKKVKIDNPYLPDDLLAAVLSKHGY